MPEGPLELTPGQLSPADIRAFVEKPRRVTLAPGWREPVERSARAVGAVLAEGRTVYGINTGFGSLARTRIEAAAVEDLQRNLLRSHAAGVGAPLPEAIVRLVMLLKVNSLAVGHSGVRPLVIEHLLELLNAGLVPRVPGQGSVGASGDLAPLAHLTLPLIGEGEVMTGGKAVAAATALGSAGLEPIRLAAKEGLALINGTQVSTALALAALFAAEQCLKSALVAGALSVDAMLGSDVPFQERIHRIRGQPGQIAVARVLARLLQGSEIRLSHLACDRVQDPYSLRCQPQVMGACLDVLRQAAATLVREANGVSDNPLVFAEDGEIVSGGNFHAEPVAFAADMIALALAEIGSIAERRIALLTDAHMSGLPPFLVAEPGLNSGFMIPQVTAAALVAENKVLAHPASVDSLPTSANQEDHVSMATHAARRLLDMAANARGVIAIELLAAAQGIDFRRPLKTAPVLAEALSLIRADVPFLDRDRPPAPDIEILRQRIGEGAFSALVGEDLLSLVPEGLSVVEGVRAGPL